MQVVNSILILCFFGKQVSPYPSEKKLQQDLVNRINWDVYKDVVKRQVYQQCPTRVTVTPL